MMGTSSTNAERSRACNNWFHVSASASPRSGNFIECREALRP